MNNFGRQNVALSLRDRQAVRAWRLNFSATAIWRMQRFWTFGIPVAERQGYGEASGE